MIIRATLSAKSKINSSLRSGVRYCTPHTGLYPLLVNLTGLTVQDYQSQFVWGHRALNAVRQVCANLHCRLDMIVHTLTAKNIFPLTHSGYRMMKCLLVTPIYTEHKMFWCLWKWLHLVPADSNLTLTLHVLPPEVLTASHKTQHRTLCILLLPRWVSQRSL